MDALSKQGLDPSQFKTKNFARKLSAGRARKDSGGALSIPQEIDAALADVREDTTPTDWLLVTYTDLNCSGLKIQGTGSGGIEELRDNIIDNDVCYGIVRKSFVHEKVGSVQADTVKFIFIFWRPETISIKRKMKMGAFEGKMKRLFHPFHTELSVATAVELSEEYLAEMLGNITMCADKVTTKQATVQVGGLTSTANLTGAVDRAVKASASTTKSFLPSDGGTASQARFATGQAKGASVSFVDEEGQKAAVAEVRDDALPVDWCLFGYESKKTLRLVGKGTGGCNALMDAVEDGQAMYGIFRVTEVVDASTTVKFCFVMWQPDDVPVMMRALLSTHKGVVTSAFRPYHCDFFASSKEELNHEKAMHHLSGLTGTRSKVTDKQATLKAGEFNSGERGKVDRQVQLPITPSISSSSSSTTNGGSNSFLPSDGGTASQARFATGQAKGASVSFVDEEGQKAAVAEVRDDALPVDWCLFGYESKKTLRLVGKGTGGCNALMDAVEDGQAMYGIFRVTEVVDASTTVKFCFVMWQPDDVPVMMRALLSTHKGVVTSAFRPYHCDFFASSKEELNHEKAMHHLSGLTGTRSKVTDKQATLKAGEFNSGERGKVDRQVQLPITPSISSSSSSTTNGGSNSFLPSDGGTASQARFATGQAKGASVSFVDEEGQKAAVAEVRDDALPVDWCLFGYESKKTLRLVGKGTGGCNALMDAVEDGQAMYGIFRVTEVVDASTTVKFCFVMWQPDDVPVMMRALLSTHKGVVTSAFRPYHCDFFASSKEELNHEKAMHHLSGLTGTRSKVKEREV